MNQRLLFLICCLLAIAQGTWAAEYVTDVMVIGADDDDDAEWYQDNYLGAGWKCLTRDLNGNVDINNGGGGVNEVR